MAINFGTPEVLCDALMNCRWRTWGSCQASLSGGAVGPLAVDLDLLFWSFGLLTEMALTILLFPTRWPIWWAHSVDVCRLFTSLPPPLDGELPSRVSCMLFLSSSYPSIRCLRTRSCPAQSFSLSVHGGTHLPSWFWFFLKSQSPNCSYSWRC